MSTNTYKPPAATIGKWLRDNGHSLGGLTGQDWRALRAAVQIVDLYCYTDHPQQTAQAFFLVVSQMQEHTRHLAYHAIAHVSDWSFRAKLWAEAELPALENPGRCKYE